jgi:hypothetical protein
MTEKVHSVIMHHICLEELKLTNFRIPCYPRTSHTFHMDIQNNASHHKDGTNSHCYKTKHSSLAVKFLQEEVKCSTKSESILYYSVNNSHFYV